MARRFLGAPPSAPLSSSSLPSLRGRFGLVLAVFICIAGGVAIGSMLAAVAVRRRAVDSVLTLKRPLERATTHNNKHHFDGDQPAASIAVETKATGETILLSSTSTSKGPNTTHRLSKVTPFRSTSPSVTSSTAPSATPSLSPKYLYLQDEAPPSNLTPRQRSQLRPKPGAARIAYYNRHGGTRNNMNWVMQRLGVNVTHVNPNDFGIWYGMSKADADGLRKADFSRALCSQYDVIIVGDTIPDARPMVQDLQLQTPYCSSLHIVLDITNRFDFGVSGGVDGEDYRSMYRDLYERDEKRFHVVANNPFELYHAFQHGVRFRRWRVLRPGGYSDVPALENIDSTTAGFRDLKPKLGELFKQFNIPVKSLDIHYGGPLTLAKYKAYIESPYQVSTMKLYENLAAGVVMMVPSPALWRELNMNGTQEYSICWLEVQPLELEDYSRVIDFYHDDLSPYMYYFDSFEMLRVMLSRETGWTDAGSKNVRQMAPMGMEQEREKTLKGWQDILFEAGALVL